MAEIIKDGTGKSYAVGVTKDNQMRTVATTSGADVEANEPGDAYNINSGIISLTNALETSVLRGSLAAFRNDSCCAANSRSETRTSRIKT